MSSVYWLARSGTRVSKWTPQTVRHALGVAIGAGSYLGWRSKRLVTQHNMAQVTGRPVHDLAVQQLAFASWRNYGRYAADFMNFPNIDARTIEQKVCDVTQGVSSWQEYLQRALQPGRGVILTSAHFGNWDIAGVIAAHYVPVSAVVETFSDARLNVLLQNQRKEKGINVMPMEGSARRFLRLLQQNQLLGIVIDRPLSIETGNPVSFFGRTTYVPGGPATLALQSGAAIIPGYVWYGPRNQLYLRAFPPIFPQTSFPGDSRSRQENRAHEVARLLQYIYDTLEEVVRENPAQWYMFRQFWPKDS